MDGILVRFARGISRAGSVQLPRYFSAEEVRRILERAPDFRSRFCIHLLWKTGMRASEAVALKWDDVNVYDGHVRVITLKKIRKKARGRRPTRQYERIIPVDDALLSDFFRWKELVREVAAASNSARKKERAALFVLPFSYVTLYRIVAKAVLEAGFDRERAHPHTFRHSFAVHLLKNGVPITVVQQLLGHSSIENTLVYTAIVQQEAAVFLREVKW